MASRWCHFKHANLAAATGGDDVSKPRAPRAVMPLLELEQARVEYDQHGKGAPQLLLLHSLLTELTVFDGVLSKLAKSRRVTRINLPGFGRSTPVQLDSVGAHADHVARVMGALELPRDTDVFGNGFGAFVALALATLDLSSSAEKIQNPTLVLCGALDQTTPPTLARALAGRIPGAYYEEIPGSGHCPMLEQPDALLAKMGEFLAGWAH